MDSKSIDVILHLLLFLGIFSSAFSAPVNPRETVDSKTMVSGIPFFSFCLFREILHSIVVPFRHQTPLATRN